MDNRLKDVIAAVADEAAGRLLCLAPSEAVLSRSKSLPRSLLQGFLDHQIGRVPEGESGKQIASFQMANRSYELLSLCVIGEICIQRLASLQFFFVMMYVYIKFQAARWTGRQTDT